MKKIKINLYNFNELSKEVQEKVIQNLIDINVNYQWWEGTYDDAENIGLKITSFELDRNRKAEGKFINGAYECAKSITKEHGEECQTYKTAIKFIDNWDKLVMDHSDGKDIERVTEEKEQDFDNLADELETDFLKEIVEDYSIILQKESEYLMSKEAIIETIEANEYTFEANGALNNG